jgi:penicillin-binding protein 1A
VATASPQAASPEAASGAAASAGVESAALPPLLTAPGTAAAPAFASEPVHGEAHGAGTPASEPTPTPDDVVPADAASVEGQRVAATRRPDG